MVAKLDAILLFDKVVPFRLVIVWLSGKLLHDWDHASVQLEFVSCFGNV